MAKIEAVSTTIENTMCCMTIDVWRVLPYDCATSLGTLLRCCAFLANVQILCHTAAKFEISTATASPQSGKTISSSQNAPSLCVLASGHILELQAELEIF